jgi:CysZ protein
MDEAIGPRCVVCGDLLHAPSGCFACRDDLQGEVPELIRPKGVAVGEVFRGALYLPRGALLLLRTPRLWKLAAVPLLINLVAVVLAWSFAHFVVVPWLKAHTGSSALAGWDGWFWGTLAWFAGWLGWALGLVAELIVPILATWLLVAFPLGILYKLLFVPFMEALGSATDRTLLVDGRRGVLEYQKSQLTIVRGMVDAVLLGLLQGLVLLILLPINLIPVAGSLVWLIVPPAVFACMDFSDLHLVRRGYATREKLRLWWTHHWRFLGYGASFFLFLTIPVINAFVIPAATVGGALLYLELDRK